MSSQNMGSRFSEYIINRGVKEVQQNAVDVFAFTTILDSTNDYPAIIMKNNNILNYHFE